MTFTDAVSTCLRKYATVEGRASRSEYWWFVTFQIICYFAAFALMAMFDLPVGLATITLAVLFIPNIAATVRRLHDIDRTGWWYLIFMLPLGGIVMLIFTVSSGTPGENRFGPPPGVPWQRTGLDDLEASFSPTNVPRVRPPGDYR